MLVVCALYGLKSSKVAFRVFLTETLVSLSYCSSYADPDIWMRPVIKSDRFCYWEYVLCYVDDILYISNNSSAIMKGIQRDFKLKHDKVEPPEYYLGISLSKFNNDVGNDY